MQFNNWLQCFCRLKLVTKPLLLLSTHCSPPVPHTRPNMEYSALEAGAPGGADDGETNLQDSDQNDCAHLCRQPGCGPRMASDCLGRQQ